MLIKKKTTTRKNDIHKKSLKGKMECNEKKGFI